MFVRLLEGNVRDVDGLRAQLEAWRSDLQAGADGWLGTTAGITEVPSPGVALTGEVHGLDDRPVLSDSWLHSR